MMSLTVIALFVGLVSATEFTAYTPATPTVDLERSHSAQISIEGDDVPDGTDRILIQAMEISDLTGNTWEEGYTFGYNSAVTTFYYPELNEASYHKFRVKYGNSDDEWTGYSSATSYSHAMSTRYIVERIARNWAMAKEFCLQLGHRLAVISSKSENEQVEELMQEYGIECMTIDQYYTSMPVCTSWRCVRLEDLRGSTNEKPPSRPRDRGGSSRSVRVFHIVHHLALTTSLSTLYRKYDVPHRHCLVSTPTVDLERSHSAQISIEGDDVPDGTDRILIQAMEISDLTGNTWEEGYTFGYNSAVTTFYYPELNEASYHKFRVKYGNSDDEWTGYSSATSYSHAMSTRYIVERIARNWAMAKEFCLQLGHRLAVISSKVRVNYCLDSCRLVHAEYTSDTAEGISGLIVNTTWTWVDGTPYKFSNFEKNAADVESTLSTSVVAVNEIGEWETHSPDEKMSFICEKGLSG
eukprot:sb/3464434/